MNVLIACEFSGIVRNAFANKGHNAWSVDLLETEQPGQHYQGSILDIVHYFGDHWRWDLMIAHPPCTYLCNSGVRWFSEQPDRFGKMVNGAEFFKRLLSSDIGYNIPRIAVENPIMHKYAIDIIGKKPDQYVQPYQFGDPESKKTGLWLKNLPKLKPTKVLKEYKQSCYLAAPGPDRWKERSRFYPGIANAMADQWGRLTEFKPQIA